RSLRRFVHPEIRAHALQSRLRRLPFLCLWPCWFHSCSVVVGRFVFCGGAIRESPLHDCPHMAPVGAIHESPGATTFNRLIFSSISDSPIPDSPDPSTPS